MKKLLILVLIGAVLFGIKEHPHRWSAAAEGAGSWIADAARGVGTFITDVAT
jgi:hypothetical protein